MEIEINANSTAYFCTSPETITWNSRTYAPVPMQISEEEQATDMSLPQLFVDVSNFGGQAFRFAKDNDLALNDVWIRMVNLTLTQSGADARIKLQILGSAFTDEVGRFTLGFGFNFDVDGPRRSYNRRDFPSIPFEFSKYVII